MSITHEELKRLLHYCPLIGVFIWKVKISNRITIGSVAGSTNAGGYTVIVINGKPYYAHRLAWFYMTEIYPKVNIDHRDKDRSNNTFDNLREASKAQNNYNSSIKKTNTSGLKGVSWFSKASKWRAQISVNTKMTHIGLYNCPKEAAIAYDKRAIELQGEFAVTNASLGLL